MRITHTVLAISMILPLAALFLVASCAEKVDQDLLEAQLAAGDELIRLGSVEEAIQSYSKASEIDPSDPRPLRRLGMGLVLLRRDLAALQHFENAAKLDSNPSAEELVFWASALQRLGRVKEAVLKYEAALLANPEHTPAMNNLAMLLQEAEPERAMRLLEEAVRLEPGDTKLVYNLGRIYEKAGLNEEAYNLIRRAVSGMSSSDPSRSVRMQHLEALRAKLPRTAPSADAPNVLLIVIDTLRADHMSLYGYKRKTTPEIGAFAQKGVVFENAISQAPWTAPSVATLFTGLYPSVHGLDAGIDLKRSHTESREALPIAFQKALRPSQLTLAEVLRRRGYHTVGFVSQVYLNSMFGFAQGFDIYQDAEYAAKKKRGEATNRSVFSWLDTKRKEPFFLFVHYNDPHFPYDPPQGFGQEYVRGYEGTLTPDDTQQVHRLVKQRDLDAKDTNYVVGLYDGEIAYADSQVGRLLQKLSLLELERGLLTVITSDHGEEFLEHGGTSHGDTLYEEQLRVPLVFHFPGRLAPARVRTQVRLVDLMPTLLELLGIENALERVQGESFAALLRGEPIEGPARAYSEATWKGEQKSLRTERGLKLIYRLQEGNVELFDLKRDPGELENLAAKAPSTVETLKQDLERWMKANEHARTEFHDEKAALSEVLLDAKTQSQLRALGYLE